ncbi:MAG: hypothetical protein PHV68_05320 [Candidatus Gastranaerophilales bacterium]|nr:hypothetical protein [Candidatus Gastranaerophilales bacterium]
MGKRKVKEYSAEFKTKVVLETLKEEHTQVEIYWKSYKYESVFLHNYFNMFDAKLKTKKYV